MDDSLYGNVKVYKDHFEVSTPTADRIQKNNSSPPISQSKIDCSLRSNNRSSSRRKLVKAASMLRLFSLPGLPWGSGGQEKVELTAAQVESLRTEIVDLEEREAYLKAQLEQIDEILRSARLAGYLYIRTRWTALPGEPPPLDDAEVDDWLPRFLVLHGPCIFFYLRSTDFSPQDSTLLSDIIEVGPLPSFIREEDEQTRYPFYMLTRQGLRFECSSPSQIQVDAWLTALRIDCKLMPETTTTQPQDLSKS
ncbi:hypothetical protein MKW92_047353 [Papaver armeniacum]|nr:hypothetical protein MKW92_047353 [Papaver armeniacum]